jgi:hypothetical protein
LFVYDVPYEYVYRIADTSPVVSLAKEPRHRRQNLGLGEVTILRGMVGRGGTMPATSIAGRLFSRYWLAGQVESGRKAQEAKGVPATRKKEG